MQKAIITFFLSLISIIGWSQVSTNPTFVTQSGGSFDIYFDASAGSAGLKGLTAGVYAHIGVITTKSTSSSDWKYVLTPWPASAMDIKANTTKNALIFVSENLWKLSITPNIQNFLGVPSNEVIKQIAVVFRNADGSKTGKTTTGGDILVDVYQAGLNIAFITPSADGTATNGSTLTMKMGTSVSAALKLYVNGSLLKSIDDSTTLTTSYTFNSTGDYTFIAGATVGGITIYDTLNICVPSPTLTESRPVGVVPGINYIDNSTVTLVLHAPNKNNVFLIGDMTYWIQSNLYQLKKDGEYWWITLTGLTPQKIYGFQYLVDGILRVSDPYAEMILDPWDDSSISSTIYPNRKAYPTGKSTGIVATFQTGKIAYNWEVSDFKIPSVDNLVIYEMLFRDFTPEKSVNAAITKLDYLQKLGVTAVELMPITEFDGNESWGYNPNHFFAADKAYGTVVDYKKFIDECHKRGMAVILDMVFNHATANCTFAALYWDATNNRPAVNNPWMNPVAPHPYSVFNDFNHTATATRDYFKRVLQFWIQEYRIDGCRMDLTKGFTQNLSTESSASNYDQSRIDNLTAYYDAVKTVKNDLVFILEHFCSSAEEDVLANKGMYLWRNVNNAYSQAAMGYQADSGFGRMIAAPLQWVGYAESHDEERNFYKAKTWGAGNIQLDSLVRIGRVPLNIAFSVLLPGPKMLWEFEELGYDYSIDALGGRTAKKPSAWGYLNLSHRKAAYESVSEIISLRKSYPEAFSSGNFSYNVDFSDWTTGRRIGLSHNTLNMVVLGNFQSGTTINVNPNFQKTGTWYDLLTGAELNVKNKTLTLVLAPGELRVYTDRKISAVDSRSVVFPTVTDSKVFISSSLTVKSVRIYSMQGSLMKSVENSNEIDVANLSAGLYLLEFEADQLRSVCEIIKK